MQIDTFWPKISNVFPNQRAFWTKEENKNQPTITDRLIHFLISYYETPSVARRAVRHFRGIDSNNFCSWNEVRVATLREIREILLTSGGKNNTWELAITIKDFLQNAFDTAYTVELSDLKSIEDPKELSGYLKQLTSCFTKEKEKAMPFRPYWSTYNRKKNRLPGEQILPDFAIKYLNYLLGLTGSAPYDPLIDRLMLRLGVADKKDLQKARIKKYNGFIGIHRAVKKYRKLQLLSKTVCLQEQPRCNVCPISTECKKVGV